MAAFLLKTTVLFLCSKKPIWVYCMFPNDLILSCCVNLAIHLNTNEYFETLKLSEPQFLLKMRDLEINNA